MHKHQHNKPDIFEYLGTDKSDSIDLTLDNSYVLDSTPKSNQVMSRTDKLKYMQSTEWKALKQQRLSIANHMCECADCFITSNLSLHHESYELLGSGISELHLIRIVCQEHHNQIHQLTGYDRIDLHPITILKDN